MKNTNTTAVGLKNLQEPFLTRCRTAKMPVTLFLMNGYQIRGLITGFDAFVVVVQTEERQQIIYKHAISTIVPERRLSLEPEEEL